MLLAHKCKHTPQTSSTVEKFPKSAADPSTGSCFLTPFWAATKPQQRKHGEKRVVGALIHIE